MTPRELQGIRMDVQFTKECDEDTAIKLLDEIERLRGLFEKLKRITGQAGYFPIEYENFVQNVTRQALAGESA